MTGYRGRRRIGTTGYRGRIAGVAARGLSVRRAGRCEACQQVRRRISTRTCQIRRAYQCEACRIGFVCISARGLSDSQGRTVRGLSVRRRIGTRTCQAHRRIGMSRLSGSQGRTVRGLSVRKAYRCEACRSVGVSAQSLSVCRAVTVRAQVGQQ